MSDKNETNIKYTMALNGCWLMIFKTTNQKQARATERSMEGRCDKQEVQGKCNSIDLEALDGK